MKKHLKNLQFFSKGETAMSITQKGFKCCGNRITCHDGNGTCNNAALLVGEPVEGSFYDHELDAVTKEINAILDKVRNKRDDQKQTLAIITTPDGLFLVWVSEGDEADFLRDILRTKPLPE
jgi:hypothetical protein